MNCRNLYTLPKFIVIGLFALAALGGSTVLGGAAEPSQREMVLWHRQPATAWPQAMPLGNGMIGAMVFGGVPEERIALNESSFWSGRPHSYDKPEAGKYFPQIRDLVFADKFQEAEKLANENFWGLPKSQEAYQPVGDLMLSFGNTNFTDYRRELDMATGVATAT
jgi:alpha-L-fucosidase 2